MHDFREFLVGLRHRRSMWLPESGDPYAQVVAAIIGFDQATQGGALIGFREWLIVKVDGMNNRPWEAIVDTILSREDTPTPEHRIELLVDLIDAYLEDRRARSVTAIFFDYRDWRDAQPWANKVPVT